jgi:hypothetical protein
MSLIKRVLVSLAWGRWDDLGHVDHWSDARAKHYEQKTYDYLGIRPQPIFPWSRKFRPKTKSTVITLTERKRA